MANYTWLERVGILVLIIIQSMLIGLIAAPYGHLTTSWLISLVFHFQTTISDFWLIDSFIAFATFIKKLGGF